MIGHGEKISRNQEKAIAALISYPSIPAAAESIGINEVTLWRWLKVPKFKSAYRKACHQVVSQAIARLQANLSKAIDTLLDVAEDEEAPASSRVAAARAILDQSLRAVELGELETRIEQLEIRAEQS